MEVQVSQEHTPYVELRCKVQTCFRVFQRGPGQGVGARGFLEVMILGFTVPSLGCRLQLAIMWVAYDDLELECL